VVSILFESLNGFMMNKISIHSNNNKIEPLYHVGNSENCQLKEIKLNTYTIPLGTFNHQKRLESRLTRAKESLLFWDFLIN